jgi:transposase InsO family protein
MSEHLLVVDDFHPASAEHVRRPNHDGVADTLRDREGIGERHGHSGLGHGNAHLVHHLPEAVAALQPLAMGLQRIRGSVERDAGRGIKVRMDHGTQYVADDFQHQVRAWGMGLSYAFVSEPETNGVAERFVRTLKKQAIHGKIFRTVEDVRQAVATFLALYNAQWRLEKNGFLTPLEARAKLTIQEAA